MNKICIFILIVFLNSCSKRIDFSEILGDEGWELVVQERDGVNIYTGTEYKETHFFTFSDMNKGSLEIETEKYALNSIKRSYYSFEILEDGKLFKRQNNSIFINQEIVSISESELILRFTLADGEYIEYFEKN